VELTSFIVIFGLPHCSFTYALHFSRRTTSIRRESTRRHLNNRAEVLTIVPRWPTEP